jgi:indole-3-glycerol phosphate synthase
MTKQTDTFLDRILERRRERVAAAKALVSLDTLRRGAGAQAAARAPDFSGAAPHIIAEVKKASPSKGLLREDFHPVDIALGYAENGAVAISVLTEEDFFKGDLADLVAVRQQVATPLLRKDFIFDPYQLFEARAAGADMFLLIMAMLEDEQAAELKALGEGMGMTALVEVHDSDEAERALRIGTTLLGINNRNLKTFHTRLETTLELLPDLPPEVRVVSESGLSSPADLQRLMAAGVNAFLIGETFMRSPSPGNALRDLRAAAVRP